MLTFDSCGVDHSFGNLKRNMNPFLSEPWLGGIASALLFLGVLGSTELVYPQEAQNRARQNAAPRSSDIELLPVQGNISMLAGAGSNITVQVGKDGVLLVDTGVAAMTDRVLAAIRTVSSRQITYIINTDDRSDHIGGNENIAKIGRPLDIARAAQ